MKRKVLLAEIGVVVKLVAVPAFRVVHGVLEVSMVSYSVVHLCRISFYELCFAELVVEGVFKPRVHVQLVRTRLRLRLASLRPVGLHKLPEPRRLSCEIDADLQSLEQAVQDEILTTESEERVAHDQLEMRE